MVPRNSIIEYRVVCTTFGSQGVRIFQQSMLKLGKTILLIERRLMREYLLHTWYPYILEPHHVLPIFFGTNYEYMEIQDWCRPGPFLECILDTPCTWGPSS